MKRNFLRVASLPFILVGSMALLISVLIMNIGFVIRHGKPGGPMLQKALADTFRGVAK